MIDRSEILALAGETGLTPQVVEKDYVLGWLLAAINAHPVLAETWVFKGGTCLKKCYFETYRFSEDLDFTLLDPERLNQALLVEQFSAISDWLYERSGIEIPAARVAFEVYDNPRGKPSCQGRIYYQSYFASGKHNLPRIKLDLTADEVLVLPPAERGVLHPYTDRPTDGMAARCYSYAEVFGEKVRALGERGRPRDLYDVINLFRNDHLPAPPVIRDVLRQKCSYKGIELPTLDTIAGYRDALAQNWDRMLRHQLPALPALDTYWDALPEFFAWLEGGAVVARRALGAVSSEGTPYRPNYGHLGLRMRSGRSLEVIRFAAGNRLCVNLDYTTNDGRRSTRTIEPYSLRRAPNGNVLLYAVRADDGQIRAYRIEQINDASINNRTFAPRFTVELSPAAELPSPDMAPPSVGARLSPTRARLRGSMPIAPRRASERRRPALAAGPIYVFRCPLCNKTFKRKSHDAVLNAHKSKNGLPCPGRMGHFVNTVY